MSKHLFNLLLSRTCFLMLLLFAAIVHSAGNNPHIVSKNNSQSGCTTCHVKKLELKNDSILNTNQRPVDLNHFKQDGSAICLSCHERHHVHADVAEKTDFTVPSDMPLGTNNGHICLTCHYSHGQLDSGQPRANVNFFDYLFDTERLHKSYLLRRDNSGGGLCLTCHNDAVDRFHVTGKGRAGHVSQQWSHSMFAIFWSDLLPSCGTSSFSWRVA